MFGFGKKSTDTHKPGPANNTASKATHEIGAIESTGEHKGEIYGGIYPADNKPIWFSAAPKLMDHYNLKDQGNLQCVSGHAMVRAVP